MQRFPTHGAEATRQRRSAQAGKCRRHQVNPAHAARRPDIQQAYILCGLFFPVIRQFLLRGFERVPGTEVIPLVVAYNTRSLAPFVPPITDKGQEHDRVLQPLGAVQRNQANQLAITLQAQLLDFRSATAVGLQPRSRKPVQQCFRLAVMLTGRLQQLQQVQTVGERAFMPGRQRLQVALVQPEGHFHETLAKPLLAQSRQLGTGRSPEVLVLAQRIQCRGVVTQPGRSERSDQQLIVFQVQNALQRLLQASRLLAVEHIVRGAEVHGVQPHLAQRVLHRRCFKAVAHQNGNIRRRQ